MARYLVALAGAVIGFLIGGPAGASIGWTAGLLIGTLLFPPDPTQGPRLDDLKVQISSYGTPIPWAWGWVRSSGNVIWATDLIETSREEGGKGGPTYVEYSYFANFTVALCRGPIHGIRRIWADSKLIYEFVDLSGGGGNDQESGWGGADYDLGSGSGAKSKYRNHIRIFKGLETDLPSPLHEQYDGVGNVPAYRDVARIDFDYFPLEDFARRIPNITAEFYGQGYGDALVRVIPFNSPHPESVVDYFNTSVSLSQDHSTIVAAVFDFSANTMVVTVDTDTGETNRVFVTSWAQQAESAAREPFPFPLSPAGGSPLWHPIILGNSGYCLAEQGYGDTGGLTLVNMNTGVVVYSQNDSPGVSGGVDSNYFLFFNEVKKLSDQYYMVTGFLDHDFANFGNVLYGPSWNVILVDVTAGVNPIKWFPFNDTVRKKKGYIGGVSGGHWGDYNWLYFGETFSHQITFGKATGGTSVDLYAIGYWNEQQPGDSGVYLHKYTYNTSMNITETELAVWPLSYFGWQGAGSGPGIYDAVVDFIWYDESLDVLVLAWQNNALSNQLQVAKVNPTTGAVITKKTFSYFVGLPGSNNYHEGFGSSNYAATPPKPNDGYCFIYNSITNDVWLLDIAKMTLKKFFDWSTIDAEILLAGYTTIGGNISEGNSSLLFAADQGRTSVYSLDAGTLSSDPNFYSVPAEISVQWPDNIKLQTIVRDVSEAAGMVETADFDVTGLGDKRVKGYLVARQVPARSFLEPLQQVFQFDGVESEGKIIYKFREDAIIVDVSSNDLGSRGEGDNQEPFTVEERQQEIELPRRVTLRYADPAYDYQAVGQQAQRWRAAQWSDQELSVDTAITMTADEAKAAARLMLDSTWQMRTGYEINLPRSYLYLDPGDVVRFTYKGVQQQVYVTEMDYGSNSLIRIKGLSHAESVYVLTDEPSNGPIYEPPEIAVPSLAVVEIIDGPLLSEQDDLYPGFYMLSEGEDQSVKYPGVVYNKSANGTDYTAVAYNSNEATIGYVAEALPWHSHCFLDRVNKLTVYIDRGSLASVPIADLRNGVNAAMIGDEIILFATATEIETGVYEISNFARGRKGTDWAASTHVPNDRFILLTSITIEAIYLDQEEIGVDRTYKAVTVGMTLDDATPFVVNSKSEKWAPLAPAQIRGNRAGSDLEVDWKRRARKATSFQDYEVPLDESFEQYRVTIYQDNTFAVVLRQEEVTTPFYDYTLAKQTTDFGAEQSPVSVGVEQFSDRYGYGREARKTIYR